MATFRGLFVRKDSTGVGTGPADARRALAGLLHRTSAGAPRQGLLSPVQVVGTTGWAYSVPAAWWATSRGLADGVVLAGSDGVVTVPTDPAPASGSRIDVIYVLHRDVDQADPDSESVVSVAIGVPSGTPVAPSIPAGAMEIARATVASTNANTLAATISQTAPYTGLAGADIVVPGGLSTFDAAVPNAAAGTRVYSLAENAVYVRAGGTWKCMWAAERWAAHSPIAGVTLRRDKTSGQVVCSAGFNLGAATHNQVIGTLPAEYVPSQNEYVPLSPSAGTASGIQLAFLSSGEIRIYIYGTAPGASTVLRGSGSWVTPL